MMSGQGQISHSLAQLLIFLLELFQLVQLIGADAAVLLPYRLRPLTGRRC